MHKFYNVMFVVGCWLLPYFKKALEIFVLARRCVITGNQHVVHCTSDFSREVTATIVR